MPWKRVTLIALAVGAFPMRVLLGQGSDAESRRQVLAMEDRRMDAIRRGDGAPLRQIYADDFTMVTPIGTIRTKADQINDLASGQLREQIELVDRTVRVYDDVAIVLARERNNVALGGQRVAGDMRLTRMYKKFGSDWRLIATQGTLIQQP